MPPKKKIDLSNLDIFGLVSGIIGLIADVISLSALVGLTKANISIPVTSHVTSVILIIYTLMIAGFYARRILVYINQKKIARKQMTIDYKKIEVGARVVVCVLAASLFTLYIYNLAVATYQYNSADILKKIEEEKSASKDKPDRRVVGDHDYEFRVAGANTFVAVFLGSAVAVGITAAILFLSGMLYQAFDPFYRL